MGAEAFVADKRRPRGSVPGEVHQALIDEFERTGCPPPINIIAEVTGIDPVVVGRALKSLCDEGLVIQPYGSRAPYVPLVRPDGTRVRPVLVVVDEGGHQEEKPKPQTAAEIMEEALRRVRELEKDQ